MATLVKYPREAIVYALFVEVNADESHVEQAREFLNTVIAPRARAAGAKAGYWLAPAGGRGVAVIVYETEDEAREISKMFQVGQPPPDGAPPGVTVRTVEVREVLASV
jgi:hypothetical protein